MMAKLLGQNMGCLEKPPSDRRWADSTWALFK